MRDEHLVRLFPRLIETHFEVASPRTSDYNCIAWAAGDIEHWWWPSIDGYWPSELPRVETLEAFVQTFQQLGYEHSNSPDLEPSYDRVALYAKNGLPTHMARQLQSGVWTSKLGSLEDITHGTLESISGESYGSVVLIMRRLRAE